MYLIFLKNKNKNIINFFFKNNLIILLFFKNKQKLDKKIIKFYFKFLIKEKKIFFLK